MSIALTQETAFTRWLEEQSKHWSPRAESAQYGPREDLRFAHTARTKFSATPALARSVASLEQDD